MSVLLLIFFQYTYATGDIEMGKKKAFVCSSCHGENGVSSNSEWPNLAAQKDQYIIAQLKNFRSSIRKNPIMNSISQTLTDKDIEDIATYYASLKPQP